MITGNISVNIRGDFIPKVLRGEIWGRIKILWVKNVLNSLNLLNFPPKTLTFLGGL